MLPLIPILTTAKSFIFSKKGLYAILAIALAGLLLFTYITYKNLQIEKANNAILEMTNKNNQTVIKVLTVLGGVTNDLLKDRDESIKALNKKHNQLRREYDNIIKSDPESEAWDLGDIPDNISRVLDQTIRTVK